MPPLIVLVGETASGKSTLALELAEMFKGELICADSWTVYKDFDIGTAKPTPEERERVRHHLLDVTEPAEGFSAPQFQRLAKQAVADITARSKLPILVGGTGLYIDSVLFDYGFLEKSDPVVRAELNALDLEQLLARADEMELDTSTIDTRNKRRMIRLIENNGARPTRRPMRTNTLVLGIRTDREHLRERITARVGVMLAAGLEAEVLRLSGRYGWEVEPMKGIGYREWREYFDGAQSLDETRTRIIKATTDLAKRQRTWFKRNDSIQWLDNPSRAEEIVAAFLNTIR